MGLWRSKLEGKQPAHTTPFAPTSSIPQTDTQRAIEAVDAASVAALATHLADTTDAHDASAISVAPVGGLAATDAQSALAELDGDLSSHIGDSDGAHDASAISVLDSGGNYAASNVEAALAEVMDALQAHEADTSDAHDASAVSIVDVGGYYAGAEVEAALQEIGADIAALDQAVVLKGVWDASSGSFPGAGAAQAGWSYIVSVGGTVNGQVFVANDRIVAIADNASTSTYASNWHKLDYTDQVLSVDGLTGAVNLSGSYQPLDSDLTAIAALSTTAFGRALLATASTAALQAYAGVREKLTADRTYYVRTDGSDSNTGLVNSAGGAFATRQGAWNVISATLDLAGWHVTIQVVDGTYTDSLITFGKPIVGGDVTFLGNTTTPTNVLIDSSSGDCFEIAHATVTIRGFEVRNSNGSGIHAYHGGVVYHGNMVYGACSEAHIYVDDLGHIATFAGANGNYTISGNAPIHWLVSQGGYLSVVTKTITLSGTRTFSTAFCFAQRSGIGEFSDNTFAGDAASAVGKKFSIHNGSSVNPGSGGFTAFPGDAAGTIDAGFYGNANGVPVSFSPTYGGASTAGSTTYTNQTGSYTRIGNIICFRFRVTWSAASGTGQAIIGGLPSAAVGDAVVALYYDALAVGSGKQGVGMISNGEAFVRLYALDPPGGASASTVVEAAGEVRGSGFYFAV